MFNRKARNPDGQVDLLKDEILDLWEVIRELQGLLTKQAEINGQLVSRQDQLANDLRGLRNARKG